MTSEIPSPHDVKFALDVHNGLGQTIMRALLKEPSHQTPLETLAVETNIDDHRLRNTVHYLLMAELLTESPNGKLVALTEHGLEVISIISHAYTLAEQAAQDLKR